MLKKRWIFLFFALLYAIGIYWGMPSEFVPEIDSEFPSGPMNFVAHFKDPTYASPYPVFHKLLVLPLYAVILAALKITGGFSSLSSVWPYGFDDPAMAMTLFIMAVRLLSLLMAAGTVCVLAAIVKEIPAGSTSRYRLLAYVPVFAFGLSGMVANYARSTNYDAPQLFWFSLSFYFLWKYLRMTEGRRKELLLAALFGGIATAVKDQIAFFIAGFSLVLLLCPRHPGPLRERIRVWFLFSAAAACTYVCAAILPQPFQWVEHIRQAYMIVKVEKFVMFTKDIYGQGALLVQTVRFLSHVISSPGVVIIGLGIVTLAVFRQWRVLCIVGVPALFSYVFTLARSLIVYERWLMNYTFLAVVAVAAAVVLLLDRLPQNRRNLAGVAAAILAVTWLACQIGFSFLPLTWAQSAGDAKSRLAEKLPALVRNGDTLSFLGTTLTLPNSRVYREHPLALPAVVYDSIHSTRMGHVLIRSDEKRRFVLSDHDLFRPERFQRDVDFWNGKDRVDTTGLRCVLEVRNPAWIEDNIKIYSAAHRARTFRISLRYYLYERVR